MLLFFSNYQKVVQQLQTVGGASAMKKTQWSTKAELCCDWKWAVTSTSSSLQVYIWSTVAWDTHVLPCHRGPGRRVSSRRGWSSSCTPGPCVRANRRCSHQSWCLPTQTRIPKYMVYSMTNSNNWSGWKQRMTGNAHKALLKSTNFKIQCGHTGRVQKCTQKLEQDGVSATNRRF